MKPFSFFRCSVACLALFLIPILVVGCGGDTEQPSSAESAATAQQSSNAERAQQLAQEMLIVDGHIDVPYRLEASEEEIDLSQRTEGGDFDYVRAKAGGLDAPFMSIYVPASYQAGGAKEFADSLRHNMRGRVPDAVKLRFDIGYFLFCGHKNLLGAPTAP